MRLEIPYLEMLITRQCSLHCDGCAVYSNYNFKDHAGLDENKELLRLWGKRLEPKTFRLLGGEPTLHKDLIEFIELAHSIWPNAERWVVSNGSHVHRHPNLPKVLAATGTRLLISYHSDDPKYLDTLRERIRLMTSWVQEYGCAIQMDDYRLFRRGYRGMGKSMRPFQDNNPVASYANCKAQSCKNIGFGRLWKCPQIMLLRPTLEKFGIADHPDWQAYLAYDGLGVDATDEELKAFAALRPESICAMCPANPTDYRKDISNVDFSRDVDQIESTFEPVSMEQFMASI